MPYALGVILGVIAIAIVGVGISILLDWWFVKR